MTEFWAEICVKDFWFVIVEIFMRNISQIIQTNSCGIFRNLQLHFLGIPVKTTSRKNLQPIAWQFLDVS